MFDLSQYPIAYQGSVKNLRVVKPPLRTRSGIYLFEFTDDYSIFDYGKMPDVLKGKGAAMAVLTAHIFELLESASNWQKLGTSDIWEKIKDPKLRGHLLDSSVFQELKEQGMRTHYRGMLDKDGKKVKTSRLKEPSNLIQGEAVNMFRPERGSLGEGTLWNYSYFHPGLKNYLIPVELVFRFGVPRGSSLLERLEGDPEYYRALGLSEPPKEGEWLPRPVIEFFSKLEPTDRFLPLETALNFSGLSNPEFARTTEYTLFAGIFLQDFFSRECIELWDGKFEFVKGRQLMLGDAVTPDELRLTRDSVQISKEPIRQYYRKYGKEFCSKINEAKDITRRTKKEIKEIMTIELKCQPEPMAPDFRAIMESMYTSLTAEATGLDIFRETQPLKEVIRNISQYV